MRPEYDFTGGVRGKYVRARKENGYTIRVYNADDTFAETHVVGEKTIILVPDVSECFPDSQAVNHALRTLLSLVPEKRKAAQSVSEKSDGTPTLVGLRPAEAGAAKISDSL
jgi:hypothetical protein